MPGNKNPLPPMSDEPPEFEDFKTYAHQAPVATAGRMAKRMFTRGTWPEARRVKELLQTETIGGVLLLMAAVAALTWANSPWSHSYEVLRDAHIGPHFLGLNMSVAHWAADGLLALFFFVVGLELKHEFVVGDLKNPSAAAVPVIAAVCGVAVPALIYAAINAGGDGAQGWAIPTATDIAFALAVLAVIGSHLPTALRSFLLTLAVVDDLIAITIIAIFYSHGLSLTWLVAAIVPIALFGVAVQRGLKNPVVLGVLAIAAWVCVLNSGIHATIAGVVLGLLVPVKGKHAIADRMEQRLHPYSAGFAVPVFAFFSTGVTVVGTSITDTLTDAVTIGVIAGLVLGKAVGIFGSTFLVSKFTRAELDDNLTWSDVFGLSLLGGIGFTVSLLIGELAFGSGSSADDHVKIGVLLGSLLSAALASIVLARRNRVYAQLAEEEERDDNHDGIPDVYQRPSTA